MAEPSTVPAATTASARSTDGPAAVRRPAVTFKVRRRALSASRQSELDGWMSTWGLAETGAPIDLTALFGRAADVFLDVGFGHGESIVAMAARAPEEGIIGVEVHTPGVATMLDAVAVAGLDNVRVVHGDLLVFLDRIVGGALAGVRIYFPDPWPKVRQHHRRIVRDDVVRALTDRLRIGGTLHLATDIADYAAAMERACRAEPRLVGGVIDRPDWRPLTRFERRGLEEGRTPVDLLYRRTA